MGTSESLIVAGLIVEARSVVFKRDLSYETEYVWSNNKIICLSHHPQVNRVVVTCARGFLAHPHGPENMSGQGWRMKTPVGVEPWVCRGFQIKCEKRGRNQMWE